jgi:hypothetical protein
MAVRVPFFFTPVFMRMMKGVVPRPSVNSSSLESPSFTGLPLFLERRAVITIKG